MAYYRLTQQNKDSIVARIVTHAYSEKEKAGEAKSQAAADALYFHLFAKDLALLQSLPIGWVPRVLTLLVSKDGSYGNQHKVIMSAERPVPYCRKDYRHPLSQDKKGLSLYEAWSASDKAQRELLRERRQRIDELNRLIRPYSTADALRKAWPEISSFVDAVCVPAAPERSLPVPIPAHLNTALKLPPKTAKKRASAAA